MNRFAASLVAAVILASTSASALQLPNASPNITRGHFCPVVLASKRIQIAQAPCRQTGGTRTAPICGGSCDYSLCSVLRDAQNRPYCGCG